MVLDNLQNSVIEGNLFLINGEFQKKPIKNKQVTNNFPYTYSSVIKGWERDDTPVSAAAANLTTV